MGIAPLRVEHLGLDWRNWRLLEPMSWRGITVPAGFISDGASIPRPLWAILPTTGPYLTPAFFHDYLIRMWRRSRDTFDDPHPLAQTRKACDDFLLAAMIEVGVGAWTRWIIYQGVRFGGDPMIERRMDEAEKRRMRLYPNMISAEFASLGRDDRRLETLLAPSDEPYAPYAKDEREIFTDGRPIYEANGHGMAMTKERYEELMGIKVQTGGPKPPPKE